MGRKKYNTKRQFDTRINFTELAKIIGLNPRQRIIMRRIMIKRNQFLKGGGK